MLLMINCNSQFNQGTEHAVRRGGGDGRLPRTRGGTGGRVYGGLPGGKLRTVERDGGGMASHGCAGPTPTGRMAPIQSGGASGFVFPAGRHGRRRVFLA